MNHDPGRGMTARSDLRGQKKKAASSLCPFVQVRARGHVTRAGLDQAVSMHPAKFASFDFDNVTPQMLETLASLQIRDNHHVHARTHTK